MIISEKQKCFFQRPAQAGIDVYTDKQPEQMFRKIQVKAEKRSLWHSLLETTVAVNKAELIL